MKGYEPGPVQASLPEAEAIQALSQMLVELLIEVGFVVRRVEEYPTEVDADLRLLTLLFERPELTSGA